MKYEILDNVYINENFKELYQIKQDKAHRIVNGMPKITEIAEGEIVFAVVNGTVKLFTKIKGKLYNVSLT
jgi:hypothetical protein